MQIYFQYNSTLIFLVFVVVKLKLLQFVDSRCQLLLNRAIAVNCDIAVGYPNDRLRVINGLGVLKFWKQKRKKKRKQNDSMFFFHLSFFYNFFLLSIHLQCMLLLWLSIQSVVSKSDCNDWWLFFFFRFYHFSVLNRKIIIKIWFLSYTSNTHTKKKS